MLLFVKLYIVYYADLTVPIIHVSNYSDLQNLSFTIRCRLVSYREYLFWKSVTLLQEDTARVF